MLHERKVAAVTAQVRAARLQGIPYRKAKKALSTPMAPRRRSPAST